MALNLQVPQQQDEFRPRICVVGVGGAGGNAINNMIASGLEGVEFLVANTDAQDLSQSLSDNRLQLGPTVTKGLGAGMQPQVGAEAATESLEEILHRLDGANMVFITAGMGGGTGTGAAPVIAKALRERNILTVGVVTKPFQFEGMKRASFAEEGIANLSASVDTLIVIPNQNLFRMANEKTTFADAFKMADNVLLDGVRGVSDLIVKPGIVNLDFADVRTLMTVMGKAMMGTGEAEGEGRALEAAERAIANPLLDDMSLDGAQGVLINVTGGYDVTLYEVDAVANHVREKVDPEANIIFGSSVDESMTGGIRVSVVATGIDADQMRPRGPQGPGPSGPTPSGPGGPGGPGTQMPTAPTPANTAPSAPPMSPFGRSPFAFRGGNRDQGPTSFAAQPAPQAVASTAAAVEPAQQPQPVAVEQPVQQPMVSPNYAPVPPAQEHSSQDLPPLQTWQQTAAQELEEQQNQDLFAAQGSFPPAPAPQPESVAQQAPAAQPAPAPRSGGLFSRFTEPKATAAPVQTSYAPQGGAAVAAANMGMQEMGQGMSAQPAVQPSPQIQDPMPAQADELRDLDAPAMPSLSSASGPRVLDIDDGANSGLEEFNQSYKSVPAFLRHQNN